MIRDELFRGALNCDIPTILANGVNGKMWMKCNPAAGTMSFVVMQRGKSVLETLSLEKAIKTYNELGNERMAV